MAGQSTGPASLRREIRRVQGRHFVYLIRIGHPEGDLRYALAWRNIDWDDGDGEAVWRGVGLVARLTLPTSSAAIAVERFEVALSSRSAGVAALAAERVKGRRIRVWVAFLRDDGRVAAAHELEDGVQDLVRYQRGQDGKHELVLEALGKFDFLATQTIGRWTAEHQRALLVKSGEDPDSDTGFDEMSTIADQPAAWYWPG